MLKKIFEVAGFKTAMSGLICTLFLAGGGALQAACFQISAQSSSFTSMAIESSNGSVWTFGSNSNGQIGNGTTGGQENSPVEVISSGATMVAEQALSSTALLNDGTVLAWGSNTYGQLGNNTITNSNVPIHVRNATDTGSLSNIIAIAGGSHSGYAVMNDGTVWAWGLNSDGQLGNGSYTDEHLPVQVVGLTNVIAVAAGLNFGVALKSDGSVWTWGDNNDGQLGDNTLVPNSNVPVQVVGPLGVGTLSGIVAIAAGYDFAGALKPDGTMWMWGHNTSGQLGIGSTTPTISYIPLQVVGPSNVGFLMGITSIACGTSTSLARKSDGTIWAWGDNTYGQFGNGTYTNSTFPVQGPSGTNWTAVAGGDAYSLASQDDGSVWGWALGFAGNLGNGGTTSPNTPIKTLTISVDPNSCGGHVTVVPPSNFVGKVTRNKFATQTDIIHNLSWTASTGTDIAGYNIYLSGQLIATYGPNFIRTAFHNRVRGVTYVYSIKAFDSHGNLSAPLFVTLP
jgi:alpha-tubulin suppressor-like RCC1 family protein